MAESTLTAAARELAALGRRYHARSWVLGTSGNFSAVIRRRPLRLAITASAQDKGRLRPSHVIRVDERGKAIGRTKLRPSAETLLHLEIVRRRKAGAVLHTPLVPGRVRMDAALHPKRRRRAVPAALFRAGVFPAGTAHAKRDRVTISLRERGVRGVVLDIEGTTTPVSFVYDVLFPYAREHLSSYVASHVGHAELDEPVRLLTKEWENDVALGANPPSRDSSPGWLVEYAAWLMQQDRKSPGLKLLQGRIWEGGYADGSLRGDVYPDVPPALSRWGGEGVAVAIYSSGSVLAQRLLFSTTAYGDLTRFIGRNFDTGVGPKREPESYERIAGRCRCPQEVCCLFRT